MPLLTFQRDLAEKTVVAQSRAAGPQGGPIGAAPISPQCSNPRALPEPGPQARQAAQDISVPQQCRARGRTQMHHGWTGPAGRMVVKRVRVEGTDSQGLLRLR